MSYEIVYSKTMAVRPPDPGQQNPQTWPEAQELVLRLNRQGLGVFARKAGGSPAKSNPSPLERDAWQGQPGTTYYFVDAWTSGNPGPGGCRVLNGIREVVQERDYSDLHTNNYYELFAIYLALQYATMDAITTQATIVIYSDSQTALSWIRSRNPQASRDQAEINRLVATITAMLAANPTITLAKWDTDTYGEIPADYGRK